MEALAWIDLETTGLSPTKGLILEYAIIITDMQLNELDRISGLGTCNGMSVDYIDETYCDQFVHNMHTDNGLFWELKDNYATFVHGSPETLDSNINLALEVYKERFDIHALHPAGSSIHFDIAWLTHHCPRAASQLHYRQLDITSLKLAQQIQFGEYKKDVVTAHRAMADAEQSLNWVRDYLGIGITTDVEVEAARLLHQLKTEGS